jgi:hypothetical protein
MIIESLASAVLLWCRAEPVVANGDDYFAKGGSIPQVCDDAIKRCEEIYYACEITGCGEVKKEEEFTSRNCPYQSGRLDYE